MAEISTLNPEDEKRTHPYALVRFNSWKADIVREVAQLNDLGIDEINTDINTNLDDVERAKARKCSADIAEWLMKCMDIGEEYSSYPYSEWPTHPMSEFKQLIKVAYERKSAEIQRQESKMEEDQKWIAAGKALAPPFQEAKVYLTPGEYKEFDTSILGAVDAYLDRGKDYLGDKRAHGYGQWCLTIKNRREEKERKKAAEHKSWEYNYSLAKEIRKLESVLYPEKQSPEDYFEKNIANLRYTGQNLIHLLSNDKRQSIDNTIDRVARRKLEELVPRDFY